MADQRTKAESFARMHDGPSAFLLPNAWDAGSAVLMHAAGFAALGTTSAGIAFSAGRPDRETLSRDEMLEAVSRIVAAVPSLPVSADLEAGYGRRPEDVAATVRDAVQAGVVGCNIEDGTGDPATPLLSLPLAAERIRAGAEAARAAGLAFVLNARADSYLAGPGDATAQFADAVARARAYLAAGAHCVFVPGALDAETTAALAREVAGPLNVLGARAGRACPLSLEDLSALGVRRVSIGGSLALHALGAVQAALREMRHAGTFSYTAAAPTNLVVNHLMAAPR